MELCLLAEDFIRHIHLERGLSHNTVDQYDRDLTPDRLVTDVQGGGDVLDALAPGEVAAGLLFDLTPLLRCAFWI